MHNKKEIFEYMPLLSEMSMESLTTFAADIDAEIKRRKHARRDELIRNICDAVNALVKEFPSVELNIPFYCPECDIEDEVNALDYLCGGRKMVEEDFKTWD